VCRATICDEVKFPTQSGFCLRVPSLQFYLEKSYFLQTSRGILRVIVLTQLLQSSAQHKKNCCIFKYHTVPPEVWVPTGRTGIVSYTKTNILQNYHSFTTLIVAGLLSRVRPPLHTQ